MSVFRGPIQGKLPDGSVIATTDDVAQALADAIAAQGAAESAQAQAEAALDSFDSRYLGPKTSDPVADNDGNPLADGVLYYNTTDNVIKVYDLGTDSWVTFDLSDEELQEISTVNSIQTEITTLADISSDVTNVSQISSDVTAVTGITTEISSVSNISNEIAGVYSDLASAAFITDFGSVGETATIPPDAGTGYIVTVFDNLDDITSVAENITVISNADVFAQEAQDARDKAELWAEENEDVEVEPGEFSSKHYSLKAESSASEAQTSEDNAETFASNALTSENNASTSESNALTSEQNAATSEQNALTSEQNASQSESNASDSADAAAISESNALTSEQNAASTYDDFDDRYLGPKSSAPTTDNDGDPLQIGALYFDTTSNTMQVFSDTGFVPAGSSVNGTSDRFKYTATSGQTSFTGTDDDGNSLTYDSGFLDVYLNGVRLINGTDFTATTGTSIDLTSGAGAGDVLSVVAFGTFALADHYTKTESDNRYLRPDTVEPTFTGTAALGIPTGTTSERPATASVGQMRFNTDTGSFEGYDGVAWEAIGETVPLILKPSPVSPSDGATGIGEEPTLNGGGFFSLYGRSHALSRFQVSDDDQFNNIVYDTGEISATTTTTIPEGTLQSGETTYYWRVYYEDDNGTESEYSDTQSFTTANFFGIDATGGTVTDITDGGVDYRVHTFTSSGTFEVTSGAGDVEYLVVAGGGGGGSDRAGGGGAGGLLQGVITLSPQSYTVTVGAGGAGGPSDETVGSNGSDSSAFSENAIGGGGGGHRDADALNGGSGGGGGCEDDPGEETLGGSGTSGQGNDGADGFAADVSKGGRGGGGGGAGSAGQLGSETSGGDGGNGIESTISGSATYYAGGGGGGIDDRNEPNPGDYNGGSGGLGGGGNGGDTGENSTGENDPQDGVANTGGGGGGSGVDPDNADQMGGDGGSGIVIIRYQI